MCFKFYYFRKNKLRERKKWSDLTKKEKDNAKARGIAGGCLIFWSFLTKAGKWSVVRWWVLAYIYFGGLHESRDVESFIKVICLCYLMIGGPLILYYFRDKFFTEG